MDHHYDIAIIGMGCAGSHVVLELIDQQCDLNIVIIDDFKASSLEKTWSYWEKGNGKWDHLTSHKWKKGVFKTSNDTIQLDLNPYLYKTIDSSDFIAYAKTELQKHSNFTFIKEKVKNIENDNRKEKNTPIHINHSNGKVTANLILDSRIDSAFFKDTEAITLKQHFKGWVIKSRESIFNKEEFVMMDYSIQDPGTTSFTYILPYSETEALIEFTYFSKEIVNDEIYDQHLSQYIKEELKLDDFEILKIEQGLIPMSSYRFEKHNNVNLYKIGTAGGWVKPSTGYSFKMSEKKAYQLVNNIIKKESLVHQMSSKKFKLYDDIMLNVLYTDNGRGSQVFHKLYKKNKIQDILSFLDEETNIVEELSIMLPMTSYPFIRAFFKQLF